MSNTQGIEVTQEQLDTWIKDRDDLSELMENETFKRLISEKYFKDEPVRLVLLLSDPNVDEKTEQDIQKQITGIGMFNQFLRTIFQFGNRAQDTLEAAEKERMRQEDEDENTSDRLSVD